MASNPVFEEDGKFRSLIAGTEPGETVVLTGQCEPVAQVEALSMVSESDYLRALAALKAWISTPGR